MITFIVTGEYSYDPTNPEPPLPGCRVERKVLTRTDYRTVPTLKEAKNHPYIGPQWTEEGTNHREVTLPRYGKCVAREVKENWEGWVLDVSDLTDITDMVTKESRIAILPTDFLELPYEIRTGGEVILS